MTDCIHLKMRHLSLALVVGLVTVTLACSGLRMIGLGGGKPEVITADDRDYFPVVHELFTGARHSIDVIIYQGRFYFQYPMSKSNALIADLVDASERGVKVRAILEEADWNQENSEDNRDVWNVLSQSKVATYFDPINTTSHSKLVIVDGKYTVVGSMNWSYYALDKNNEATVVVESPRIAREFEAYFEGVLKTCRTDYGLPEKYLTASEAAASKSRNVFIEDVVDSGRYEPDAKRGLLYLGDVTVVVDEDALEETLALDSLFFAGVAGDSVRIFGEIPRSRAGGAGRPDGASGAGGTGGAGGAPGPEIHALDIETAATRPEIARAFSAEDQRLKTMSVAKPALAWASVAGVTPVPNQKYIPEVTRLIHNARKRVWVAILDARYYETRPVPPERDKPRPKGAPPSLTNELLAELEAAARRGVDVQVICDVGQGGAGSAPPTKLAFMQKVKDAGGKSFWDSPDVTTHAKLAIVDDRFTVVGSTNWSQPAVEDNNETSVVVDSPEVNRHYAGFISGVKGEPFEGAPTEKTSGK